MNKYYPYKSDKPDKKYYIITKIIKKFILVRLALLISLFTKTKNENKDILIDTKQTKNNFGINQELILLHFGAVFYYGKSQQ